MALVVFFFHAVFGTTFCGVFLKYDLNGFRKGFEKSFGKGSARFLKRFSGAKRPKLPADLPGTSDTSRVASCLLRLRSECFTILRGQEIDTLGQPSQMDDTPRVVSCLLRLRSTWFSWLCWYLWLCFEVLAGRGGERDSGCSWH